MAVIVKVAVESALPQLDKLYDYLVPDSLAGAIKPGVRLEVPFGRAKKLNAGFAIEMAESSEIANLSEVSKIVSEVPVLTREVYELCQAVANRQAATLHDVLRLAIPPRSVRVEQKFELTQDFGAIGQAKFAEYVEITEKRVAFAPVPNMLGEHPGWVRQFVAMAAENLRAGLSTVIVVPDYRDQAAMLILLESLNLMRFTVHYSNDQTPSLKYQGFLRALHNPSIILGSRSAIFAPAPKLGSILIYNDGDSSLVEPTSPYLATREIALIRQQQNDCQLIFAGQARSCETQRLIEIGYLTAVSASSKRPKIAFSETEARLDSLAFQTIKKALAAGESVLIQVASPGVTTALYCRKCATKFRCKFCQGPIGLDSQQKPKCRWCASFNLDMRCPECTSNEIRQGSAGSTRTLAELGKSFPQVALIEATGDKTVLGLPASKRIVVATVGAEPIVEGGYSAVVLLDAPKLLARDTLRANENAVRQWADAVSLMKPGGSAVLVGVSGKLGQDFALWNLNELAAAELAQRRELGFPPAMRMASITAEAAIADKVVSGLSDETELEHVQVLGPLTLADQHRYLVRYDYAVGAALAQQLKARIFAASGGSVRQSSSGRNSRAVKLKMDDAEVI